MLTNERVREIIDANALRYGSQGWEKIAETAALEAAAEATAAFKARVRAQAIQPSPRNRARPWRCGLCKGEWWSRDDERHIAAPDGHPCAAEGETP
jgi:hypothetical protein